LFLPPSVSKYSPLPLPHPRLLHPQFTIPLLSVQDQVSVKRMYLISTFFSYDTNTNCIQVYKIFSIPSGLIPFTSTILMHLHQHWRSARLLSLIQRRPFPVQG
jgi:hypothetical protein